MTAANKMKLAALHRHWIIADAVRVVLWQKVASPKQEEAEAKQFGLEYVAFGEHASTVCRMQVWYSLLFVVIDGYKEIGLMYAPLEVVLAKEEYVGLLRRFRNATFHYQTDPLSDKLIDFLNKEDSEVWIGELNKQLEAFFMWALPIKEAMEELKRNGIPEIPVGTRLETLFNVGKKPT